MISNFIVQALKGEPLTIFGDGLQSRCFCYVDDMIEALVAFMDSEASLIGPINFGNPVESTMLELGEVILRLTGSSSKSNMIKKLRRITGLSKHEFASGTEPLKSAAE